MKRPADVSSLLTTLLSGQPIGRRLRESAVWRVWDKAVGEPIASKARPVAFRDGVLTVSVISGPWLQQLSFLKQQLIEAVNSALGEPLVEEMYLKAGRMPAASAPRQPAPRSAGRELSQSEYERITLEASAIPDEELRCAFIRCHAAWISTTPSSGS